MTSETMRSEDAFDFTGVVVCLDEAAWLEQVFESLSFCRELILVDLGSTDDSVAIAERLGARILTHERVPYPNLPRQFGISQARCRWVVTIDPDEVFPKHELPKILEVLRQRDDLAGVRLPWQFYFLGRKLSTTVWGRPSASKCAVVNRDRIEGTPFVHREFRSDQPIHRFSRGEIDPIRHYWISSFQELFVRQLRYAKSEGEAQYNAGRRFSWPGALYAALITLKRNLFNYRGFIGGWPGWFLSFYHSWYVFISWLSLRRYQRQVAK